MAKSCPFLTGGVCAVSVEESPQTPCNWDPLDHEDCAVFVGVATGVLGIDALEVSLRASGVSESELARLLSSAKGYVTSERGNEYYRQQNYAEAVREYAQAVKEFEQAALFADAALFKEVALDTANALFNQALCLCRLRRFAEARDVLRRASEANPDVRGDEGFIKMMDLVRANC